MNRFVLYELLDTVYKYIENHCADNGYKSNHKIDIKTSRLWMEYTVTNSDNQDTTWKDVFILWHVDDDYTLKNDKNTDEISFLSTEPYQQPVIRYILKQIYDYKNNLEALDTDTKAVVDSLNNYTITECESIIKESKERAESAYGRHMYEEAAELDYNYDASRSAFAEYCYYDDKAKYFQNKLNKLTNNQGE